MSNKRGILLQGDLVIFVDRAADLLNLDKSILSIRKKDVSDPFVTISFEDSNGEEWEVATTKVIDNNLNPIWNETLKVIVCHDVVAVIITVKDDDLVSSEVIGTITFTAESICNGHISGTFDLLRKKKHKKKAGQLTLDIKFSGKHQSIHDLHVPECLYPMRSGNLVRLYQDAHCPSIPLVFPNKEGKPHSPNSAWRDLYHTIVNAQKMICILGWSLSAKIPLLRWEGEDNRTLGELLRERAMKGVYVRVLLWDELTSNDIRKTGLMSTEDQETFNYFEGTGVTVKLVPRDRDSKDIITRQIFSKFCYSHHQKVVIADMKSSDSEKRHLVAYVGGLDLTGGRFDTPEHPLFSTLGKEHKDDFYNRIHPTTNCSGPRQPWHDIHSRVEGPVAADLLSNFQERWQKQGDGNEAIISFVKKDASIDFEFEYREKDSWNVQMIRSINSDSAVFNWVNLDTRATNLSNKKGRAFDNSLHRAYIHNIRRAKKFIYIENQYFLGSSHFWLDCRDVKARNLVPLEICLKIEEKIRANERFVAYIVIPMFPEGRPADKVTQEILHWQFRSIEMMYARIGAAIQDVGSDAHPQDYLIFLCLGKKESNEQVPEELQAPMDDEAKKAFENRRLMIYVHSKMAIFDDEYIIVGSANINDRSLSGNRDTEIAIGAFQPNYSVNQTHQLPYGDVALFRRSLWSEHMGTYAPIDLDPSSIQCAKRVLSLGEENLNIYKSDTPQPCPRHMLIYPLQVNVNGKIKERPDCAMFPDTKASVIGSRLPNKKRLSSRLLTT